MLVKCFDDNCNGTLTGVPSVVLILTAAVDGSEDDPLEKRKLMP
jgi:hypothetical protein